MRSDEVLPSILQLIGAEVDDGLTLNITPAKPVKAAKLKLGIEARFEHFHRLNPHVLDAVVSIALDLKSRGFNKGGMKQIFERLRWLYAIQTRGEEYRLNNDFTAYYARVVMAVVPTLDGFFETRERTGKTSYTPDLVALGLTDYRCP